MAYTTINKHTDYFDTVLWSSQDTSIDTLNFQPDWAWIKSRTNADTHVLFDAVRGANKRLISSANLAESTTSDELTAFNSDGYTLGTGDNVNRSGHNYVSWNWKANGAGSANTDGTINSTVSVNTTAGFSIVKWTGNNTGGATVGHGLGAVPKMIIFRNYSITEDWTVYHHKLTNNNYKVDLNNTSAQANVTNPYMENTTPTSSLITLGDHQRVNGSGNNIIAYCFAEKSGYNKFGSYVGNGNADGAFIYTGFKPAFIMLKKTNDTANWMIHDNKRLGYNVDNNNLKPNTDDAEATADTLDILSNGFKLRTSGSGENNGDFIYMAFGQSLVGTNNIPATAR